MRLKDSVSDFLTLCFVDVMKIQLISCVRNMPISDTASSMIDYHVHRVVVA